jgi:hypothetical protein
MRPFRSIHVVALAAVIVLSVGIGVSTGAIPSSTGKIDGCFVTGTGDLRVIDKAKQQTCAANEQALSWNQQGPKGPPGISEAFEARQPLGIIFLSGTDAASANTIVTIPNLKPGAYVVQAKLNVTGPGTTSARIVCDAALGDASDRGIVSNGGNPSFGQQSIKMQLAVKTTSASSATLRCHRENLVGGTPVVSHADLIAMRVGSVTTVQ